MRTITIMTAAEMAEELRKRNIVVLGYHEGDDVQDGVVIITPRIHVQVPNEQTYGLSVVRETGEGNFNYSPELANVDEVVAYIESLI